MPKNDVNFGLPYLRQVLSWPSFLEQHSKFAPFLRFVLKELYYLRHKVVKLESELIVLRASLVQFEKGE